MFGPQEVRKAFGLDLELIPVPEISFSEQELLEASVRHEKLIYVPSVPLRVKEMSETFFRKRNKRLLYNASSSSTLEDEDLFFEVPDLGWKLVSPEIIPATKGLGVLDQTGKIIAYLKASVFKLREIPSEYVEAIDEFDAQRPFIKEMLDKEDLRGIELFQNLKITQLTRETAAEAIYRLMLNYEINGQVSLKEDYTVTRTRAGKKQALVGVSSMGESIAVDTINPSAKISNAGVSLVRRAPKNFGRIPPPPGRKARASVVRPGPRDRDKDFE